MDNANNWNWVKELPVVPGAYWVRYVSSTPEYAWPALLQVFPETVQCPYVMVGSASLHDPVSAAQQLADCEFCGPLIAPLPPPQLWQPDWDLAPDWAKYWAVDEDDDAYWYGGQPRKSELSGCWMVDDDAWSYADKLPDGYRCDWQTSLHKRPEKV